MSAREGKEHVPSFFSWNRKEPLERALNIHEPFHEGFIITQKGQMLSATRPINRAWKSSVFWLGHSFTAAATGTRVAGALMVGLDVTGQVGGLYLWVAGRCGDKTMNHRISIRFRSNSESHVERNWSTTGGTNASTDGAANGA
jgi:hypothetical protein